MSEKQISGSLKWDCSENQQPFHWIGNLEGEALRWWISLNQKPSTAKEFRDTFAHRFIINNAASERQRWARIAQTATLTEYIERFNQQAIRVLDDSDPSFHIYLN